MQLMHRQSANLAKARVCVSRRPVVVAQARLATRRRGVTLQRLEGGSVAVQEPVYADSFTSTNRRPSRISDSVVVPSRTFPALVSFPSITQQDAGQMASIIKHELLSHSEALIVVNGTSRPTSRRLYVVGLAPAALLCTHQGSEALMTALESLCTTNKLLINEGRNMQVSIRPRSLGEDGFKEGNFVLEASLCASSFPAVGAHLDAPGRFNPRRAAALVQDILAHPSVLMTCMGESAIESALMTLAVARSRLESDEPSAELTVMVKPFGDEIAAAATGYALYISRTSSRAPAPAPVSSRPAAAAPRTRAPSPARRGAAWRLAQEFGGASPSANAAPSYSSASASPASRSASPARKGTAWRLAQMADASAPAPASRATSSNEREQRSVTPTRRRGGIAARFGADTPEPSAHSASSSSAYASPSSTSASSSSRAVSRGRVRRGGAAARFGVEEGAAAAVEEPRVVERRPAREASPARRRGGIAAKFAL